MFCSGGRHRNQCRPSRGGFFILQLHDELIYEVAEEDAIQVIKTSLSNYCIYPVIEEKFSGDKSNSIAFTGCTDYEARNGECREIVCKAQSKSQSGSKLG